MQHNGGIITEIILLVNAMILQYFIYFIIIYFFRRIYILFNFFNTSSKLIAHSGTFDQY